MIIHEINNLRNDYVINLLKSGLSEITDHQLVLNYHPDYSETPGNLFQVLKNGRYEVGNGKYYVLENDGEYICSSGWNKYDTDIALVMTRTYTIPSQRMKYHVANHILPLSLVDTQQYKHIWITCNDYNKKIYDWFERTAKNKRGALFNDWPDIYKKFLPIGKKDIYYVEQYVVEYSRTKD